MKDTFKNSIVVALAVFGLITFLSSATNSPAVTHDIPATHIWSLTASATTGEVYRINALTGEVMLYTTLRSLDGTKGLKEYRPKSTLYGKYH
jgi:hypothetical protein